LCGAGENVAYIERDGRNMSYVTNYMQNSGVRWIGQLRGASTPEASNPADFWPALSAFASAPEPGLTDAPSGLTFLAIGDWGGGVNGTQPGEVAVAVGIGEFAATENVSFVLALGDNFYPLGLCNNETLAPYNNTCAARFDPRAGTAADPRFQTTFESVFSRSSLKDIVWHVVAGNHDALGNVSASITYSQLSRRWHHPHFWYKVSEPTGVAPGEMVDILMFDTTLCYGIWSDPEHDVLCQQQLGWLEEELAASTAAYLFVGGHYPVWSACAHGNTEWAIQTLLPLMAAYNATGYLSGHDHCGEFLAPPTYAEGGRDMVFLVSGTGDGCCYDSSNIARVPAGSLKYLLSQTFNPSSEVSGFASIAVTAASGGSAASTLRMRYHGSNGTILYVSPAILPRMSMSSAAGPVMAAADYASAGLPRPSDAIPAGKYIV